MPALPSARSAPWRLAGVFHSSVVLDEAELVPLRVGHHDHDAHVVVVPLAGASSTELLDLTAADVDVIDLNVEVQSNLRRLGLGNRQTGQTSGSLRRTDRILRRSSTTVDAVQAIQAQALPGLDRFRDEQLAFDALLSEDSSDVEYGKLGLMMPGSPGTQQWIEVAHAVGGLVGDDPSQRNRPDLG